MAADGITVAHRKTLTRRRLYWIVQVGPIVSQGSLTVKEGGRKRSQNQTHQYKKYSTQHFWLKTEEADHEPRNIASYTEGG